MIRNANDRCENVCQLIVPVVIPFTGRTTMQPMIPPIIAMISASARNDRTMLPPWKPERAKNGDLARALGDRRVHRVQRGEDRAEPHHDRDDRPPSTVISVVTSCDCDS